MWPLAREGANGILYHAKSQEDVDNFISSPPSSSEKYSVVLGYHLLTRYFKDARVSGQEKEENLIFSFLSRDNALALHHCGHVSGLIVLLRGALTDDQIASAPWSPDTTCPNCQYGLYANDPDQYVWNPQGQGLIEEAFDKPIFAINPVSGLPLQVYNQIMTVGNRYELNVITMYQTILIARVYLLTRMRATRIIHFTVPVLSRSCGRQWIRKHV